MKKLLILLFSFFLLSSPSVFAETYFCVDDVLHDTTILKRQGSEFSYKTSIKSTLKIVYEDAQYLFLMGNFRGGGSTVFAINKLFNKNNAIWFSPDEGVSSGVFPGRCTKD
jgi:hypothetical protein